MSPFWTNPLCLWVGFAAGRVTHLLCPALVGALVLVVDAAEVGDDDGHGQGDHQHPAQGADGAKDLPSDGLGHHVTVAVGTNTQGGPCFSPSLARCPGQGGTGAQSSERGTTATLPCLAAEKTQKGTLEMLLQAALGV